MSKWTKASALARWKELEPNQPILRHMTPIDPRAKGSRYGACGIRIDGNPQFVDAVLSRLQDLIDGENALTRLGLSRNIVESGDGRQFDNAEADAECCYIRLHMRGGQARQMNAFFGVQRQATERYAQALDA